MTAAAAAAAAATAVAAAAAAAAKMAVDDPEPRKNASFPTNRLHSLIVEVIRGLGSLTVRPLAADAKAPGFKSLARARLEKYFSDSVH